MSDDELICLGACLVLTALWWRWFWLAASFGDFGRNRPAWVSAFVVPALAMAGLFVVLRTVASYDVRSNGFYTFFYMAMGAAWLRLVVWAAGCLDFVMGDDWIERGNPAAAISGSGLLLGAMAAFAGGNIGDGPGWWVVVFSAGLATGTMFLCLACMNLAADVIERITVGRDVALAVRTGAFLLMAGVISGRAVAGDWVSVDATMRDYLANVWPLLGIAASLCVFERVFRRSRLSLSTSAALAAAALGYAVYCLVWAGAW